MRLIGRNVRSRLSWMEDNRTVRRLVLVLAFAVVPLALVFGMELIGRGSVAGTWNWMVTHPKLVLLNGMLQLCVLLVVYALLGTLFPAIGVVSAIMSLMTLINYFKTKLIGQPFFPWDLFLKKESMDIAPLIAGPAAMKRVGVLIAIVVALLLLRLVLPRFGMRLVPRLALGALALVALYSFGVRSPWAAEALSRAGVYETTWDQQQNYADNGLALAFTLNVKNSVVPKPSGYGEESISTLAQSLNEQELQVLKQTSAVKEELNGRKPNVIFIMNEAFWDPTLLTNVSFSSDPLPTVHRLQQESTSGYLLSPQYGGGTSNVEYEVLTGQSMSFLPAGSVPYQQYITKPLPSLASFFKSLGYNSLGMHTYEGWFWNRQNVYKSLGFDSFKSQEQFVDPEYKGTFIADAEMSRSIVSAVEESEEPAFIYAVTMQNHGPYDTPRYAENTIQVQGSLTPAAKSTLETYTQGAYDADQSLQMLIDHFQQSDEPTLIVFFGDHLPMLGYDYDVYKQAGFIRSSDATQWSLDELKSMHQVPFVTWSNFNMPQQTVPILSDSFLGSFVLDALHLEKPAQFAFNSGLSATLPGLLSNLAVDSAGNLYPTAPESAQAPLEQYRQLQYDQLFGQQYVAKYYSEGDISKLAGELGY